MTKIEDSVNHPTHYTEHPSGIECIQITRNMGFNLGNAIKYIWRADLKGNAIQDLEKAKWYIEDQLKLLNRIESMGSGISTGQNLDGRNG